MASHLFGTLHGDQLPNAPRCLMKMTLSEIGHEKEKWVQDKKRSL